MRADPAVIDAAIEAFIAGVPRSEVVRRFGISQATLGRHMRRRGLSLSDEEIRRRQREGGAVGGTRAAHAHHCEPGCGCARHRKRPVIRPARKNCTRCGRWRPLTDFHPRERDAAGEAIAWQSLCQACMRISSRTWQGIRRRGKPFEPLVRKSRAEKNAVRRERYARKKAEDPEWHERRREYNRIRAEAKRREAGVERRTKTIEGRVVPGKVTRVSTVPLAGWIDRKLSNGYKGDYEALAIATGVDESTLRKVKRGQIASMKEDTVDRMLINEGGLTTLMELYPELYP